MVTDVTGTLNPLSETINKGDIVVIDVIREIKLEQKNVDGDFTTAKLLPNYLVRVDQCVNGHSGSVMFTYGEMLRLCGEISKDMIDDMAAIVAAQETH